MLRTNKIKYWILPTCHTLGHEIFLAGPPPEKKTSWEFHMFKKMYRVFKTIYSEYLLGGSLWWKIARIIGPDWFIMEVFLFYLWVLEASRQFKGWLVILLQRSWFLRTHFKRLYLGIRAPSLRHLCNFRVTSQPLKKVNLLWNRTVKPHRIWIQALH